MGPDAMILVFWMLSFKPIFFTFLLQVIQNLDANPLLMGTETQPPIALQDVGILFPSRLCSFKRTHCWLLHPSLPRLPGLQSSSEMAFYSQPHTATASSRSISAISPYCSTISQTNFSNNSPNCCPEQSSRNTSSLLSHPYQEASQGSLFVG